MLLHNMSYTDGNPPSGYVEIMLKTIAKITINIVDIYVYQKGIIINATSI